MKKLLRPLPLNSDNPPPLSVCVMRSEARKEAGTQKARTWLHGPLVGCVS